MYECDNKNKLLGEKEGLKLAKEIILQAKEEDVITDDISNYSKYVLKIIEYAIKDIDETIKSLDEDI